MNPTVEALLGYTERDWRARPFMEFIHPDDRVRSEEETRRVFEGATVRAFENRVLCKDGAYKWIEWTATPVVEGRVIYAVGRDVTERRRSEHQQAALQRIATLVAQEVPQAHVFGAIAEEIGGLLGTEEVRMLRFASDGSAVVVGGVGRPDAFSLGARLQLEGDSAAARVLRTGRPARVDDYRAPAGSLAETARSIGVRAVVAVPVFVERRLWGVISAGSTHDGPLPPDAEDRLDKFTRLMATAIANAEAHAEAQRLAHEQAALRRVATLVAEGVRPAEIFAAVSEEVASMFGVIAVVYRFDDDGPAAVSVGMSQDVGVAVGTRRELVDGMASAEVYRTARSARVATDWSSRTREVAEAGARLGVVSQVASPIVVEGRPWGAITIHAVEEPPLDTEARLEKFTELVATAIANAESQSELTASRRRIVAAADDARRRIERDLHDGIQQRLVALTLRARSLTRKPPDELPSMMAEFAEGLGAVADELREVARGIHPTVLTEAGLGPALRALGRRSGIPIDVDVAIRERLPASVEVATYYVASEALTNAAKHSRATVVELAAVHADDVLTLEVRDDGVGGAEAGRGSGIVGLIDRVEALGGTISIASVPGCGTTVSMRLPTALESPATTARPATL